MFRSRIALSASFLWTEILLVEAFSASFSFPISASDLAIVILLVSARGVCRESIRVTPVLFLEPRIFPVMLRFAGRSRGGVCSRFPSLDLVRRPLGEW